jgi:osmotically-inducible protein OsmY
VRNAQAIDRHQALCCAIDDAEPVMRLQTRVMESAMKSDEALWHEIEQTLHWDRAIDAGQIRVHVHNGVVTLTGTVPNVQ